MTVAFVFGGTDKFKLALDSMEKFDSNVMRWSNIDSMPLKLANSVALSHAPSGLVYVLGGRSEVEDPIFTSAVHAFDSSCNRKAKMPFSFLDQVGYVVCDAIYIVGMLHDQQDTIVVLCYNISDDAGTDV